MGCKDQRLGGMSRLVIICFVYWCLMVFLSGPIIYLSLFRFFGYTRKHIYIVSNYWFWLFIKLVNNYSYTLADTALNKLYIDFIIILQPIKQSLIVKMFSFRSKSKPAAHHNLKRVCDNDLCMKWTIWTLIRIKILCIFRCICHMSLFVFWS